MCLTLAKVGRSVVTMVDSARNGKSASKDVVDGGGGEVAIITLVWHDDDDYHYQSGKGRDRCKWMLRITIDRTG